MTGLGTSTNQSQAVINLRAYMNPIGATQQALVNYSSLDTLVASASAVLTGWVGPGTSDYEFDLATMFPAYAAPIFCCIIETTNPGIGFSIGTSNISNKCGVGPNGFFVFTGDASTALPSVWVDNDSLTDTVYLSFIIMTQ
jgi:hypothetical protein